MCLWVTYAHLSSSVVVFYGLWCACACACQAKQEDVIKHFEAADPHHGDIWTQVTKAIGNWRKSPRELLVLAAKTLPAT